MIAAAGRGRPIRFLAAVVIGWIGIRVFILWPQAGSLGEAVRQGLPGVEMIVPVLSASASAATVPLSVEAQAAPRAAKPVPVEEAAFSLSLPEMTPPPTLLGSIAFLPSSPLPQTVPYAVYPGPALAPSSRVRPSLSTWLFVRGSGSGREAFTAPQLGGSQAGARLRWPIRGERIALSASAYTPIEGRGAEVGLGLEWRPVRAPVALIVEQRVMLDRAGGGPAIALVGGVDSEPLGQGFRLEAYGQAGAIQRARTEPFADGFARITRDVGQASGARLALGAGIWGGVQRDASRIDIGPSLVASLPVGPQRVRIALDWRHRVGGDAAPGSGPALTVGTDF